MIEIIFMQSQVDPKKSILVYKFINLDVPATF